MSQVFEGYERLYCDLSADPSRKCAAARALRGEQKQQKVSEINGGIDEAEALVPKMDLEARTLQPSVKAALIAKLREYRRDLNNIKDMVKRISNPVAGDELF
ncbi:vesicle transport v-SNARE 13-like [Punica granatum]|uniref:Vesicle transport v-SNARE 13-like n=1 Tax=Punica granatum TaxID=22663 RepID=A0A6P8E3F4_PUNGR|nr:vesicle transport v-SNARE 13-like [Punica granatum]XP_031404477.1 vesicle transport v-SNARE 13-like [Punica granatum]